MKWKVALMAVVVAFIGIFLYKEYIEEDGDLKEEHNRSESTAENETEQQGMAVQQGLLVGQRPPNIQLSTLGDKSFKLTDYKNKIVILNFWATWCPPCKAEMPDMQEFYENHKDEGVEVIAVNLTSAEKSKEDVQKFIDEYNIQFTIPLDQTGAAGQQYEIYSIPSSFIIDRNGTIRQRVIGPMSYEWMVSEVKELQ